MNVSQENFMSNSNTEKIELSPIYNVLMQVSESINGVCYKYTSEDDFRRIDSLNELQLVYWGEIIQRIHACGSTSVLRLKKWYDAVIASYEAENYFGFCASLRGLLESCADTFHTAGNVILPIAENHELINIALNGKAKIAMFAEEVENELIHYIFARKLTVSERKSLPESHSAKQVRVYIEALGNKETIDLYSELCQVTHPSTMSLIPFMMETEEHGLVLHKVNLDKELNKNILDRHKKTIYEITKLALLPSLCLLKLINEFDDSFAEPLKTPEEALQSAIDTEFWEMISKKIEKSKMANTQSRGPEDPPVKIDTST